MDAYIERAIDSVLAQTFADWELLIQDAGSTDGTPSILERVALDPRIHVAVEPDDGQADAINRGLRRATGRVLGWLNADDELEPTALEQVVSAFAADDAAELVYANGTYIDAGGMYAGAYDVREFDPALLLTRDYILQPAAFWSAGLWERVGQLDASYNWAFDWDWFIRASMETHFVFLNTDLARYRLTGANKSLTGGATRQAELAEIARRHGGRRQPTYLYWLATRARRRFPPARLLQSILWRLFPGRIMG